MKRPHRWLHTLTIALTLAFASAAPARATEGASNDRITALEREVAELRRELDAARHGDSPAEDQSTAELGRRIDVLATELARLRVGDAAASADTSDRGMGPAASKVYRTERGVSIGGYGEMVYENYASEREDDAASGKTDRLDLLRAIVYFGYKFDDRWLVNTEIEIEHATSGEGAEERGEVSVEFAYVDYLARPELNFRAGLVLMPVGLLNELHEPTVFLGALRPDVERNIIPTTWRENGVGVFGDVSGFTYRSYVVNGLRADGYSSAGLRGGRQSGSKASAENFAWVGRLDYTGHPGLLVGGSLYAGGSGQGLSDVDGDITATTTIVEGHLDWRHRGLQVRALAARATVDDAARLNAALGLAGSAAVGERLTGGYVEVGYDVLANHASGQALIPFVRWEALDTQAGVPAGFASNPARDARNITIGAAWKPIDQLVVKADYLDRHTEADSGVSQFNVGLGYIF